MEGPPKINNVGSAFVAVRADLKWFRSDLQLQISVNENPVSSLVVLAVTYGFIENKPF